MEHGVAVIWNGMILKVENSDSFWGYPRLTLWVSKLALLSVLLFAPQILWCVASFGLKLNTVKITSTMPYVLLSTSDSFNSITSPTEFLICAEVVHSIPQGCNGLEEMKYSEEQMIVCTHPSKLLFKFWGKTLSVWGRNLWFYKLSVRKVTLNFLK